MELVQVYGKSNRIKCNQSLINEHGRQSMDSHMPCEPRKIIVVSDYSVLFFDRSFRKIFLFRVSKPC